MAAKIRYLRKQPIHICANAKSVFVQPWRAVFAHSSPHCPLTPCQRWNTNIEQAKNEKSSILACPQEAIHPLKFTEHLFEPISGKKLLRNKKYMTKSNPFINKLYPLTKPRTLPWNGMGSIETEQFYLNFKFTSSLINSLRHKKNRGNLHCVVHLQIGMAFLTKSYEISTLGRV